MFELNLLLSSLPRIDHDSSFRILHTLSDVDAGFLTPPRRDVVLVFWVAGSEVVSVAGEHSGVVSVVIAVG